MKFGEIRKSLLTICIVASIILHVGAIWFLFAHPLQIPQNDSIALMKPAPDPQTVVKDEEELIVEKMEKALEESLNTIVALSHTKNPNEDIADEQGSDTIEQEKISLPEEKKLFVTAPKIREEELPLISQIEKEYFASMPPLFDPDLEASLAEFAQDDELDDDLFPYQSEKYASIDFSDHRLAEHPPSSAEFVEDDFTMTDDQFLPSALPTQKAQSLTPEFMASLQKLKNSSTETSEEMTEEKMFSQLHESTLPQLVLPNSVDYLRNQWIKRSLAENKLPDLDHYGLETIASNLVWEEEIDVDITLMPEPDSNKYIFSLTVHPEFETDCEGMHQNFYFVIDRSSSVEKHKFSRFKRAVQRSLAALREGDRFNIYFFDKKVSKLSDRNLAVTPKTLQMAEDFLERHNAKTHFAATEVYTSLETMLPDRFQPDELHSVILLTDGNTLLNAQKQKKAINFWAEKYEGNVNFYTAAAGKGNNLVLLDLLSYATAGKLLYSDTNAAFPRKLVRLVKDLHYPIMKNITIEASTSDTKAQITLHPRNQYLPPMFAGQTYTITGTVDELCDLTLFIQGKNHDRWLNIRKDISLKDANRGGRSLEKLWANTQSKICYEHFLKNGKNSHLKEARQIVAPHHGIIASDQ